MTSNRDTMQAALDANVPIMLWSSGWGEKQALNAALLREAADKGYEVVTVVASRAEPTDVSPMMLTDAGGNIRSACERLGVPRITMGTAGR